MASVKLRNWFKQLFARTDPKPRVLDYHAVSIRCASSACQAAKDAAGERHLSAEAPLLPLKQCDRPDQCTCRYQHFDDRRGDSRRRSDQGLQDQNDPQRLERRYVKDRRAQDDAEDSEPFSVHEGSYYEHMGDTVRTAILDASEADGVDPYNSGSFDRSKSWGSSSDD